MVSDECVKKIDKRNVAWRVSDDDMIHQGKYSPAAGVGDRKKRRVEVEVVECEEAHVLCERRDRKERKGCVYQIIIELVHLYISNV